LIAFRALALLIVVGVNGVVVAGVAVLLGDKGPKYDGRLTILPSRHVDVLGGISLVLFGLGWQKPMAVDAQEFRIGRAGILAVILAGFVALLLTAVLLDALVAPALTTLPDSAALATSAFLREATSVSLWFAMLSVVPIPPLTGGLLLTAFGVHISRQAQWILAILLLAAVAFGVVRELLEPIYAALARVISGA
jgi:hypothetical protein